MRLYRLIPLDTTINPPPDNHLAIPLASTALVPRGAMCTAGMAMLGSALQPPRLHAAHLQMQYFGRFSHEALLSRPAPSLAIVYCPFRQFFVAHPSIFK